MFSTEPSDDVDMSDHNPQRAEQSGKDSKNDEFAETSKEPGRPRRNGNSRLKAMMNRNSEGDEAGIAGGVLLGGFGNSNTKEAKSVIESQRSSKGKASADFRSKKPISPKHRSSFFLRHRLLHLKFYGDYWEDCEADSHKRTREEVEQFLDELAQNGHNAHSLRVAAHKIQKRAKLASDYHPERVLKAGDSLGPLTLVIPMIRFHTNVEDDPGLYKLADFFCKLAAEDGDIGRDAAESNEIESGIHQVEGDFDESEEEQEKKTNSHDEEDTNSFESSPESGFTDDKLVDHLVTLRSQSLFSEPFLFWGRPNKLTLEYRRRAFLGKSEEERLEEARYLAGKLEKTLHSKDLAQVTHTLREFIKKTQQQKEILTHKSIESKTSSFEKDSIDSTRLRALNEQFYMASKTHFHWIASDFAQFLDYNVGSLEPNGYLTEGDPLVKKSQELWSYMRGETVEILIDIQERLFNSIERLRKFFHTEDEENGKEEDFVIDLHSIQKKRRISTGHSCYQAVLGQSDFIFPPAPPFMVMVENLPIYVTEEHLDVWYSRCGEIHSISIQNKRPDLDPGRLTKKRTKEISKASRPSLSYMKDAPPRSPVYALLEFADEAGYQNATQQSLSVFGMVVDRHAVRSTPLPRLRSLFIENLDQEDMQPFLFKLSKASVKIQFPMDEAVIRSELQKKLDPVCVALESGEDGQKALNSCQIRFPSFEVAWYAYEKLTKDGDWNHVHWIQTPKDAMEWWTRRRGFY